MDYPEGIACPIPPKRFSFVFWQEWQAIALSWGGGGQKKIGKDKRESLNFQIKPGQKPKLSLIFILYQNKLWNRVMLKKWWRQRELREKEQQ